MKEKLDGIKLAALALIENAVSTAELNDVRVKYLGKSGEISLVMRDMANVPKEERPAMGKLVNELRSVVENALNEKTAILAIKEEEQKFKEEEIDVTLSATGKRSGNLHPLTLIRRELIDIFLSMGFSVDEGPEIESDLYNFQLLNIPKDHPSRDMQDTFYLTDEFLLRTQTSAGQIRVMEKKKPPIKVLSPGRVFRSDDDATHSPMFHQMEGLVVDKGITLCDLQGMLDAFARAVFSENSKTRLRPSYFPFTEPSVEVDVSCAQCGGKGCSLCKGTGWIEVLGAGMVNRRVLENCGVDPEEYSGFAFGMGVERIAMLKYGMNNIKLLTENDVRFLEQFKD